MYNHDFHHKRNYRTRRLIIWLGVAFSVLIFVGAATYSVRAGLIPGAGHTPISVLLPGVQPAKSICPAHPTGNSTVRITSNNQQRSFLIHLPPSYGQQQLPLVVNYHGYDSTADYMARYTNMAAEADAGNFIVVFPQGGLDSSSPPKTSWNAGIGAGGPTGNDNDVLFTSDMLSYLQKNDCVDPQRIFVTGYSIGASMAYRVACTLSNQIAGLATVEGAFYHFDGGCQPSRPLSVLEIHGQADLLAPYDGDQTRMLASVERILNIWFDNNKCDQNASQIIFQKDDVIGTKWSNCADQTVVEHYKISDGGHVWPGSSINRPDLGFTTHTIDANVVIWNFFSSLKL